ncbi:hypothetical protein A3G50_00235 [Candidatus Jorgensenbacteria bacterium RIFCSPLOWO2_12_FULL_42_11]|uniref:FAD/NAD(P)-binding domain-containing protein n=1 Tax=Candidatus Jorgensenbacteria bacterium RIFCSPLOWO2_12_FULL_42_11 TaxID=1798473 RepID=A0A1F6C1L9_9BACT|nr:MAG: hypothetical protein A3G50_00235 [Candidatus Jorgensenbacteria bacterium RIFCSPLOWO2_12_FULL_42_11]
MESLKPSKKIVIVGGGFGGIRAALDLAKRKLPNAKIVLISDKPYFEYSAALYRAATGRSLLEARIPLKEIFNDTGVEIIEDAVARINLKEKILVGGSDSRYSFDFLVLSLGNETAYFNIPGLQELSFGFKSVNEALRLKKHLHELFASCEKINAAEKICAARIIIIGAGASGAELAGELAVYRQKLAKNHRLDPSLIAINLIEAAPRILPLLPEDVSKRVEQRLRDLGVDIFLNKAVTKEDVEGIYLKDMEIKTKTVVWAAGLKPNYLYGETAGLEIDKKGRVLVNEYLQPKDYENVFVIGDAAATLYAGMAQTAIRDGKFAAKTMIRKLAGKPLSPYQPRAPFYAIPAGPGWAAVIIGRLRFYGKIGWWLRQLADFRFFLTILSPRKAILVFQSGKTLCESCAVCLPQKDQP